MKLPKVVLDVVRGAGGAAVALAIGCSSQTSGIREEPAARLAPIVVAPVAAAPVAAPPTLPEPVATLVPVPEPEAPPELAAEPDAGTPHRRHHRQPGIGHPPDQRWMAACGRG